MLQNAHALTCSRRCYLSRTKERLVPVWVMRSWRLSINSRIAGGRKELNKSLRVYVSFIFIFINSFTAVLQLFAKFLSTPLHRSAKNPKNPKKLSSVILSFCRLLIRQELFHDVFLRLRNPFLSQKRAANDVADDKDALHPRGLVRVDRCTTCLVFPLSQSKWAYWGLSMTSEAWRGREAHLYSELADWGT